MVTYGDTGPSTWLVWMWSFFEDATKNQEGKGAELFNISSNL
jgi:hypothetical protein